MKIWISSTVQLFNVLTIDVLCITADFGHYFDISTCGFLYRSTVKSITNTTYNHTSTLFDLTQVQTGCLEILSLTCISSFIPVNPVSSFLNMSSKPVRNKVWLWRRLLRRLYSDALLVWQKIQQNKVTSKLWIIILCSSWRTLGLAHKSKIIQNLWHEIVL